MALNDVSCYLQIPFIKNMNEQGLAKCQIQGVQVVSKSIFAKIKNFSNTLCFLSSFKYFSRTSFLFDKFKNFSRPIRTLKLTHSVSSFSQSSSVSQVQSVHSVSQSSSLSQSVCSVNFTQPVSPFRKFHYVSQFIHSFSQVQSVHSFSQSSSVSSLKSVKFSQFIQSVSQAHSVSQSFQ